MNRLSLCIGPQKTKPNKHEKKGEMFWFQLVKERGVLTVVLYTNMINSFVPYDVVKTNK